MPRISAKRLQVDKANARIVLIVAIAAFLATFALVASKSLMSTRAYQARVISEKEKAVQQLIANKEAIASLQKSYTEFNSRPLNIIDGNPEGTGDRDGENAKIVLDALPSKYDFPGLTSSIEKLLAEQNYKIDSITGTDDEVAQQSETQNPEPIEIPFEFQIKGNYSTIQNLLQTLEKSIRPFEMTAITMSGTDNETVLNVSAKTYYLPGKSLTITKKVVE